MGIGENAENSQKTQRFANGGADCGAFFEQPQTATTALPQSHDLSAAPPLSAGQTSTNKPCTATPADPNLAHVIDAWPYLPEPIQAGILAMIAATVPKAHHPARISAEST